MKETSEYYEIQASRQIDYALGDYPDSSQLPMAQVYATLAMAAAVAEQTEVLKGLVVNGQLKVWAGVK